MATVASDAANIRVPFDGEAPRGLNELALLLIFDMTTGTETMINLTERGEELHTESNGQVIRSVHDSLARKGLEITTIESEEVALLPALGHSRLTPVIDPIDGTKAFDNWGCKADEFLPCADQPRDDVSNRPLELFFTGGGDPMQVETLDTVQLMDRFRETAPLQVPIETVSLYFEHVVGTLDYPSTCGGGNPCSVTMTQNLEPTASFTQNVTTYTLAPNFAGQGTVTSADGKISCTNGTGACTTSYAHSGKVLHRDVKPTNIMIRHNGLVGVTHFRIAKMMTMDVIKADRTLGTHNYMSPEQLKGGQISGRSHIFSTPYCSLASTNSYGLGRTSAYDS